MAMVLERGSGVKREFALFFRPNSPNSHAFSSSNTINVAAGPRAIFDAAKTLDAWLHKKTSKSAHFEALSRLADRLYVIEGQGAGPHATRGLRDLAALHRTVSRIDVISRTGFIASGYALIEVVAAVIIFLIVISNFKSFVVELVLCAFATLIFV